MSQVLEDFEVSKLMMQPDTNSPEIDKILSGSFYACFFDKYWYFGIVNYVSVENLLPFFFLWMCQDDICCITINNMICKVGSLLSGEY